ncbi:universal stress protein [Halorubrum sp. CBA1125]|uniref:universal stress protein n=1 Tax=Halorubrum sp. CBA1125 TaxID=2668072 RepID=UPI0012E78EC2|nr:universal stress protein [Halorubrum sp. CBA1125]MUW14753.1 universal stress protein [Halorubrum sp. CBA1125]
MSVDLFDTVLVPIADPDDAARTARALRPYLDADSAVIVTHVVPKGEGVPDKASVEQRESYAEEAYEAFLAEIDADVGEVTPLTLYGRDVAATIADGAVEAGATAIAFVPREATRWVKIFTGDVSSRLVSDSDVPVISLPGGDDE